MPGGQQTAALSPQQTLRAFGFTAIHRGHQLAKTEVRQTGKLVDIRVLDDAGNVLEVFEACDFPKGFDKAAMSAWAMEQATARKAYAESQDVAIARQIEAADREREAGEQEAEGERLSEAEQRAERLDAIEKRLEDRERRLSSLEQALEASKLDQRLEALEKGGK